jgi:hypothetical protein
LLHCPGIDAPYVHNKYSKGAAMPARENSDHPSQATQRERALSRWDNKGGAGPDGPAPDQALDAKRIAIPDLSNADLVTLRVGVIALENLVISLLANASEDQLKAAREMASYISPRPGFTPHPLTIHAAAHMVDLIQRAGHFRGSETR